MSEPARLSIALYPALSSQCNSDPQNSEETTYHWSLVLSTGVPTGDSLVDEYQITTDTHPSFSASRTSRFKARNICSPTWKLSSKYSHLLSSNPQLHGCVLLPPPCIDISRESLSEFICEYTAWQGGYRLTGSRQWSCEVWILRILEDLVEAAILDVELEGFEPRIFQRGRELERAARGEGGEGIGGIANGLRTVEY